MADLNDLDDHGFAQTKSKLHWKSEESSASSDWTFVLLESKKEFKVHLKAFAPYSTFFEQIHAGVMPLEEKDDFRWSMIECSGDLKIKTATGAEFKLGHIADTVYNFKRRIEENHGISEYRQRLLRKDQKELDQEWRKLSDYGLKEGDTLQVVLREPWQRSDLANRKTFFNLPKIVTASFEVMLDYVYTQYNEPRKIQKPTGSPETFLGLIWLAAPNRLDMHLLGLDTLNCLRSQLQNSTAHTYMGPALSLGLEKVYVAACRLAATFFANIPAGALNALDPVEIAKFLKSINHGGNVHMMTAKNKTIAAYIRDADDLDILGGDGYHLIASEIVKDNGNSNVLHPTDLLIILQKSIKFQDRILQDTCIPLAAKFFQNLQKQDLQLLPTTTIVELLSMDNLAVLSEDNVVTDVEAYVACNKSRLTRQEELSLWSCCRFAYCSPAAQSELQEICRRLPELAFTYLEGQVARNTFTVGSTPQTRPRNAPVALKKSQYTFGQFCSPRIMISGDNLTISNGGSNWEGGILEPAIATSGRKYIEFNLECTDSNCNVTLGVIAPSKLQNIATYMSPVASYAAWNTAAYLFHCYTGSGYAAAKQVYFGGQGRCKQGDRIGLVVEHKRLDVLVNGNRVGTIASDLPQLVQLVMDMYIGCKVSISKVE